MIHIGIGFDFNFYQPFFAWSTSLSNNNPGNSIHIHAICYGIPDKELRNIEHHVNKFGKISFYTIDQDLLSRFVLINNWTPSVYYRLFLPSIMPPGVDRLLYLDLDTVVLGNISGLYNIEMGNYPIAAVYDNYVKIQPDIGIMEEGKYFNSGMMLINLQKWTGQEITSKAIDFLTANPEKIKYVDQCALNAVLKDNWHKISEKYNFLYSYIPEGLSFTQLKNLLSGILILHFTIHRPWNMLCENRYRYLYFHYLMLSGFQSRRKYGDFKIKKIPSWLKIRLLEFYFDSGVVRKTWKKLKKQFSQVIMTS